VMVPGVSNRLIRSVMVAQRLVRFVVDYAEFPLLSNTLGQRKTSSRIIREAHDQ
jgi:hypothetical protein